MIARVASAFLLLALGSAPPGAPAAEDSRERVSAGLVAYFTGDFDQAAVTLKRSIEAGAGEDTGVVTYLLARSFQELGMRGLALHYFDRAEEIEGWARPARRGLARLYFEVHENAAVLEVVRRAGEGDPADGELAYLGGVAAAALGRWDEAERLLTKVPQDDPAAGFALYARAQAHAARERFDEALGDLATLVRGGDHVPQLLRDQAHVLRGKILYLRGRDAQAQDEFAAVSSAGSVGYEALRGLLLAKADPGEAARAKISEARPGDLAAMLTVRAVAAEERQDLPAATGIRERLRSLIERRLHDLEQAVASEEGGLLVEDLARFAGLLRMKRWRDGCGRERARVEKTFHAALPECSRGGEAIFEPEDPLFHEGWRQARADPWLRGSIELRSRARDLVGDLERVPEAPPFWKFWASETGRRLTLSLAAIRLSDLERLFADHLHTQEVIGIEELRDRKNRSVDRARTTLRGLYVGEAVELPAALSNLGQHLEYKESDMRRLVNAVPERSTDPVTSLLGDAVDLLEEIRTRLLEAGREVPHAEADLERLRERLQVETGELAVEIARRIRGVVVPTLRQQLAFFTRLGADNEGALSRLYARNLREEP